MYRLGEEMNETFIDLYEDKVEYCNGNYWINDVKYSNIKRMEVWSYTYYDMIHDRYGSLMYHKLPITYRILHIGELKWRKKMTIEEIACKKLKDIEKFECIDNVVRAVKVLDRLINNKCNNIKERTHLENKIIEYSKKGDNLSDISCVLYDYYKSSRITKNTKRKIECLFEEYLNTSHVLDLDKNLLKKMCGENC